MSFFDMLKEKAGIAAQTAGTVAQNAVQQTKTVASIGRLKLSIASEEEKIKKAYTELGRLVYRDYEAGTEPAAEEYQLWYDKISDAKAQIVVFNEEIEKLKVQEEAVVQDEVPAEEPAIVIDLTAAESEKTEVEAPQIEVVEVSVEEPTDVEAPAEPQVGTLYVDITGEE